MENTIMENITEVAEEITEMDLPTEVMTAATAKDRKPIVLVAGGIVLAVYGAYKLGEKGYKMAAKWIKARKQANDLDDPMTIPGEGDID